MSFEKNFYPAQAPDSKPFLASVVLLVRSWGAGALLTNIGICSVYVLISGREHWNPTLISSSLTSLKRRSMH